MTAYSPAALKAQLKKVAEAAITADLEKRGWRKNAGGGYFGVDWSPDLPSPTAGPSGTIRISVAQNVEGSVGASESLPGMKVVEERPDHWTAAVCEFDPWESIYKPWYDRINTAFQAWDEIPLDTEFDPLIEACRTAVAQTTLEAGFTQEGGDVTADGDLNPSLQYIARWIGPDVPGAYSSQAIGAFDYSYGAARMATVIGNQRQAMITAGLCLTGAKSLWGKAGTDVMKLAESAQTAFENLKSSGFDLELVKAFVDLASLFAVGPLAPLGTALGVADKVVTGAQTVNLIISKIAPKDVAPAVDPAMEGSSAEEVFNKLQDVMWDTGSALYEQERALIDPLKTMVSDMAGDLTAYHIHPKDGMDPDLASAGTFNVNSYALIKALGTAIPMVVAKLASAADSLDTASNQAAWVRPLPRGYGTDGAWPELHALTGYTAQLARSSGHELIEAQKLLAGSLGLLDEVDDDTSTILKDYQGDLKDAGTGSPKVPGTGRESDKPHGPYIPGPWYER